MDSFTDAMLIEKRLISDLTKAHSRRKWLSLNTSPANHHLLAHFHSISTYSVFRGLNYNHHTVVKLDGKANLNKEKSSFPLNFFLTAKICLSQHMKFSVIRPQSTKIPINYDD